MRVKEDKIVSHYREKGINLIPATVYKHKGTFLCTSGDANILMGVSRSTRADFFRNEGIEPKLIDKNTRNNLYDLRDFMHKSKIMPFESIKTDEDDEDASRQPLDKVSIEEAKRRAEIERVKNLKLKNAQLNEELIPSEILDKELAFQAALHISLLRNEKTVFPNLLEQKSREEIEKLISDYQKDEIDRLQSILRKKKAGDLGKEDVSALIYAIISELGKGATVDELMERICSQE